MGGLNRVNDKIGIDQVNKTESPETTMAQNDRVLEVRMDSKMKYQCDKMVAVRRTVTAQRCVQH